MEPEAGGGLLASLMTKHSARPVPACTVWPGAAQQDRPGLAQPPSRTLTEEQGERPPSGP